MVPSPGFIQFRKVVTVLNSGLPGIHIQNRWKMTTLVFLPQDATQLQFPCNSQQHDQQASPLSFANLASYFVVPYVVQGIQPGKEGSAPPCSSSTFTGGTE